MEGEKGLRFGTERGWFVLRAKEGVHFFGIWSPPKRVLTQDGARVGGLQLIFEITPTNWSPPLALAGSRVGARQSELDGVYLYVYVCLLCENIVALDAFSVVSVFDKSKCMSQYKLLYD